MDLILTFFLGFIRISCIIYFLPLFGSYNVPWQVKMGLSFFITLIVFPFIQHQRITGNIWILALNICHELIIGLTMAFIVHFVFDGIRLAGQFVGYQMGFAIVNVIDPYSSNQISITSQFKQLLALLVFLGIGAHHFLITAIVKSFEQISLGNAVFTGRLMENLIHISGAMFSVALKIAAPILVTLIFTNVALSIIAKTMPQINVFIVGFPLEIGIGLLIFAVSIPFFVFCLKQSFHQMAYDLFSSLRLLGGH